MLINCGYVFAADKYFGAPKGGYAVSPDSPFWISGVALKDEEFTKSYPKKEHTEHFSVVNAGLWLANNGPHVSVLIYSFELDVKKSFGAKVFTKIILPDPVNIDSPIIYTGTLSEHEKSTRVNHNPVIGIKKGNEYKFIYEVYSDVNRRNLIERVEQRIYSPVDNYSGCVVLEENYKKALFGDIKDKNGRLIPLNKIIVACDK